MPLKLLTREERKANERFGKLIAQLNSKQEAERLAAVKELREQWPDGLPRLLTSYQAVTNLWKKRWRGVAYSLLWLIAGNIIAGYFILYTGYHKIFPILEVFWLPLGLSVFCAGYGKQVRSFYARHLLNFDDVKIVGPLIDALNFKDLATQQEARQALIGLLPRLQASDAHLLNGEQREQLRKVLSAGDKQLIIPVLKAYEHIGDSAELEAVERLLYVQNAILIVEIKDVALNCLPFLQLRAQQLQSSQTLLRASEHATTPDILLRPAADTQTEDKTQLLRMSSQ